MSDVDQVASISAARYSRKECVTALTNSYFFEWYVTWTGTSSIEVFVKVIAETLKRGKCKIAATALLTFVALDQHKRSAGVPTVIPEIEEERKLHETAPDRARIRKELATFLTTVGI